MDFRLQQDKILLRRFDLSEAPVLFKLIDQNRDHLRKWLSWVDNKKTVADIESFLQDERVKFNLEKGIYSGIWYNDSLSGIINLDKIDLANRKGELGYWLSRQAEGKGIMYRACTLLIDYAFETLKLHRIGVSHIKENIRSQKLINKLGFIREGITRESGLLNGKYMSHIIYGLLASEWNKIQNQLADKQ